MIFSPSVPQSGTWFVLRFFERLGYKIEHTGALLQENVKQAVNLEEKTIMNAHVFPFYYSPSPYKESWPSFGASALKEHVVRADRISISCIRLLASMYKTVIPIRDPLASLLTRENRAPNLRHFYIVDAYVEVVNAFHNHPNVKFLPVDLNYTVEERKALLMDIVNHCEVPGPDMAVIDATAEKWGKENVTPNNLYTETYEAGNIDALMKMLGPKSAEVKHLKNMGGILIPFLGELGYNRKKTLIW